jgi:hypothetical protein
MTATRSLAPDRERTARHMRRVGKSIDQDQPEMMAGDHMRDAARVLERGHYNGAKRHLDAAIEMMTPRNLVRHGITDDEGQSSAKHHMHDIHRARLMVQDLEDAQARNNAHDRDMRDIERAQDTSPGYQKPAPGSTLPGQGSTAIAGGRDPVAPGDSRLAGYAAAIELVGPEGYVHGWIKVSTGKIDTDAVEQHFGKETADHIRAAHATSGDEAKAHYDKAFSSAGQVIRTGGTSGMARVGQRALLNNIRTERARAGGPAMSNTYGNDSRHGDSGHVRPSEAGEIYAIACELARDPVAVRLTELSAQTGALAVVHHPFGRPGGPGLWHVKGMELPAYIQNIAHALLRTGRAKTLSQAIAIAKGATARWAHGGGSVHPEVRAASAAAGAQWAASQARAHAHTAPPPPAEHLLSVELAGLPVWERELRGKGGRWTRNPAGALAAPKAEAPTRGRLTYGANIPGSFLGPGPGTGRAGISVLDNKNTAVRDQTHLTMMNTAHQAIAEAVAASHIETRKQLQQQDLKHAEDMHKLLSMVRGTQHHVTKQADTAEGKSAKTKLAVEGGLLAAGGIIGYIMLAIGAPPIAALLAGLGPPAIQIITEWRKRL